MNDILLARFNAALAQDRRSPTGKKTESWRHKAIVLENPSCLFCGCSLVSGAPQTGADDAEQLRIDHLIPQQLGGPHEHLNLVASCLGCKKRKNNQDWLACALASDNVAKDILAAHRMKVMESCRNHLLQSRETARTKPYVLVKLRERWAHPRFTIRAALTNEMGLIGFGPKDHVPSEIVVQLRHFNAFPATREGGIFSVPASNFHPLVWHLIERNAWIQRMDLGPDYLDLTPSDDSLSRWHETFTSVDDIHRRREKLTWVHPAKRPPRHERPMDPCERRHLAGLIALKTGQPIDHDWLARHRTADDDFLVERKRKVNRDWLTRHS